jgi:hypothetical protein
VRHITTIVVSPSNQSGSPDAPVVVQLTIEVQNEEAATFSPEDAHLMRLLAEWNGEAPSDER